MSTYVYYVVNDQDAGSRDSLHPVLASDPTIGGLITYRINPPRHQIKNIVKAIALQELDTPNEYIYSLWPGESAFPQQSFEQPFLPTDTLLFGIANDSGSMENPVTFMYAKKAVSAIDPPANSQANTQSNTQADTQSNTQANPQSTMQVNPQFCLQANPQSQVQYNAPPAPAPAPTPVPTLVDISGRWSIEINRLLPSRTGQKIVGTGYIVVDISNSTFSGSFTYTEMIDKKQTEVNALIVGGMYLPRNSLEWRWVNRGNGQSTVTASVTSDGTVITGMSRKESGEHWEEACHTYTRKRDGEL